MWAKGGVSQRGPDYSLERCQEPELVCACTRVCLILPSRLPPSARPNTPTQGWNPAAAGSIRVPTKALILRRSAHRPGPHSLKHFPHCSHRLVLHWTHVSGKSQPLLSPRDSTQQKLELCVAHGEPTLGNEPKNLLPQSTLISSCPNFLCPNFWTP